MAKGKTQQTAELEGEFAVFLIGMRLNKPWKIWSWFPVFLAMPRMLIELGRNPDLGMLHARSHFGFRNTMVVQYWKSFEALHAYAVSKDSAHLPAWKRFNQKVADNRDVGIWHETYVIEAGKYENFYGNMPPYGMGRAGTLHDATGRRRSARGRLGRTDGTDQKDTVEAYE